jgi:hypothetical protein
VRGAGWEVSWCTPFLLQRCAFSPAKTLLPGTETSTWTRSVLRDSKLSLGPFFCCLPLWRVPAVVNYSTWTSTLARSLARFIDGGASICSSDRPALNTSCCRLYRRDMPSSTPFVDCAKAYALELMVGILVRLTIISVIFTVNSLLIVTRGELQHKQSITVLWTPTYQAPSTLGCLLVVLVPYLVLSNKSPCFFKFGAS